MPLKIKGATSLHQPPHQNLLSYCAPAAGAEVMMLTMSAFVSYPSSGVDSKDLVCSMYSSYSHEKA